MQTEDALYYLGVKAVIKNHDQILLLHVTKPSLGYEYWDLPGGRLKERESIELKLRREVAEETGISDIVIEAPMPMSMTTISLPLSHNKEAGVIFAPYLCRTQTSKVVVEENMSFRWCTPKEAFELLGTNKDYPRDLIEAVRKL